MTSVTGTETELAPERTSVMLARFAQEMQGQDVRIGALLDALKDRGFGIVIVLFALPSAVLPIAWILGTPIMFFAAQLILGLNEPWLPEFLRRPLIGRDMFAKLMGYAVKYLGHIEEWLKPRWMWITHPIMERVIGAYMVFITVVLLVPIVPLGNALPSFGIGIMAAGLLEKDGVAILFGALVGLIGAIYVLAVLGGAWAAFRAIFGM